MPRDDTSLFARPLVDILSQTLQMKQAWLEKAKAAISLSEHRHFSCMTQERTLMRNWLNQIEDDGS